MSTRLASCLVLVLLVSGCRAREVEKDLAITDVHTGWYDAGIVNGKAKKLARPPYPPAAKEARITGKVEVRVTIDETGTVLFACAQSGPSIFYPFVENAALGSKFSPTIIDGKPVKVVGIIVYNFIP